MAVTKRLRYEILRRDNHTCRYCGAAAPEVNLTIDHVIPTALGGTDEPSNLVTACVDCNSGKTSSNPDQPLVDDVTADAMRWADAMKRAADQQRHEQETSNSYRQAVIHAFTAAFCGKMTIDHDPGWHYTKDPDRTYEWVVHLDDQRGTYLADTADEAADWIGDRIKRLRPPLPADWDASLHVWDAAGIDREDLRHAARVAERATHVAWWQRYAYFCGVIWRTLEDRQQIARDILDREER